MRIPRLTTKRWMIAVAVLAAVLSRPAYLRSIARRHEQAWKSFDTTDLEIYFGATFWYGQDSSKVEARRKVVGIVYDMYNYHKLMQNKYEEAARRPWLLLAADPPPPPTPSKECLEDYRRLVKIPLRKLSEQEQNEKKPASDKPY